jgi:dTMP kinase
MFITFEGIDFSGKTTQAKLLHQFLRKHGFKSILLREPGATHISEKIRDILLDPVHDEMFPITEFLLFSAARSQLVNEIIKPKLKQGIIVICDRYYDSSTSYQGFAGNLQINKVHHVNEFATSGLSPDITIFVKLSPQKAMQRAVSVRKNLDRIENKKMKYYRKVSRGFNELAKKFNKRFVIIDGDKSVDLVHNNILEQIKKKKFFQKSFNK